MKAPKPEAAPKGWIATGKCFFCRSDLEAWHPVTHTATVRHVADKRPYGACDAAARKAQTSK